MIFNTIGNADKPAILFFHAMGVNGDSSIPVANFLKSKRVDSLTMVVASSIGADLAMEFIKTSSLIS